MTERNHVAMRNVAGLLLATLAVGAARMRRPTTDPIEISVKLSEWKVELSQATVMAGAVRFAITNAGSIPHAVEVEGNGIEQGAAVIQPGAAATLTVTLKPGTYDVYCPVGQDSHKQLGMDTRLNVVSATSPSPPGYGAAAMQRRASAEPVRAIRVTGGGPLIQILPGPPAVQ